jgi:O-antigen chain-terminating methyltransferase
MNADEETRLTGRAAALLERGPGGAPGHQQSLRGALRRTLLRLMRPYTYHQRLLDVELLKAVRGQEASFEAVRERDAERIERLEDLARDLIHTAESLRKANSDVAEQAAGVRTELTALRAELNALPFVEGTPFETFETQVGEVVGFRSSAVDGEADSGYIAFEDLFRGSTERVVRSQRPYLALLRGLDPVLDVGCGRGEMLALLADEGIAASGVDNDPDMVERCRELGLDVALGDANEHLSGLQDGSLGAVFSAQVVEHLHYRELRQLLELARRKLRPGGRFIAETVNPHRIASLKTFWVDLTHRHPIFPEVALAMCAVAGFEQAYVFAPGFDGFEPARFDSPAYAVVATTP